MSNNPKGKQENPGQPEATLQPQAGDSYPDFTDEVAGDMASPTVSGKVADRPHRLTLILSTAAVLVSLGSAGLSLLSLEETRVNRRINEHTSRAYLRIVSLMLDTHTLLSDKDWADKFIPGSITLTNTGRVAAQGTHVLLDINPPRGEMVYQVAEFEEVVPGASITTSFRFKLGRSKDLTFSSDTHEYSISVKIEYDSGISQGKKVDEVFFCVPKPPTKSNGLVLLTPCDTHFDVNSFK